MRPQPRLHPPARWLVAALVTCAAGCGGGGLAEVEGTVTLDGRPLPDVEVVFVPVNGANASACTDGQGRFRLRTAGGRKGGLAPGLFQVIILDLSAAPDTSSTGGALAGSQSAPNLVGAEGVPGAAGLQLPGPDAVPAGRGQARPADVSLRRQGAPALMRRRG